MSFANLTARLPSPWFRFLHSFYIPTLHHNDLSSLQSWFRFLTSVCKQLSSDFSNSSCNWFSNSSCSVWNQNQNPIIRCEGTQPIRKREKVQPPAVVCLVLASPTTMQSWWQPFGPDSFVPLWVRISIYSLTTRDQTHTSWTGRRPQKQRWDRDRQTFLECSH